MKILIRNLARTTTEEELKSFFTVFGMVQSCDLVLDKDTGKSKGFAFVEMPKAGEAKVAIKKLNNKELAGNKIRVKKAEHRKEDKVDTKNNDEHQLESDDKEEVTAAKTEQNSSKKFSWTEKKLV